MSATLLLRPSLPSPATASSLRGHHLSSLRSPSPAPTPFLRPRKWHQGRMGDDCGCFAIKSDVPASTPSPAQSRSPTAQTASAPPPPPQTGKWEGYAELVAVSVLWGTYNPTLKLIYAEDHPLDPSTLTAIRTVLSAGALLTAVVSQKVRTTREATVPPADDSDGVAHVGVSTSESVSCVGGADAGRAESWVTRMPGRRGPLAYSFVGVVPAGLELGLYNFLGTATQALGVQQISATRASFLVQTISLLVPIISFLGGEKISAKVWTAVAVGLVGSSLVAYDGLRGAQDTLAAASGGDDAQGVALVLTSCVFYSLAVVRLGTYAPRFNAIDLAAVKKVTLSAASLIWFANGVHLTVGAGGDQSWGEQLAALGISGRPLASYALVAFSALGPGAGATFLQTLGQSSVPATAAQVIYSLTPLWSAIAAQAMLGDEGMSAMSWVGGGAVLGASLLSALAQAEQRKEERRT